ncbi:NAD(P)-dependent oxidoreductase [Cupriavidus numazuensis]|uniref:2-(Hydroxymethyl)glutarate dehydrogenase n=1 Tax=Cupriavidus numazuensis TaxID=221992 RepID=A0ABM8TGG6_9BURK|nr:NAD(P)-dependent oxidoreductase [Cupriavidus numazuensis]CAG2144866.1 2-(hydroxymethyl)glutarate dehydrogenase [Cupriavidus numazuensis]
MTYPPHVGFLGLGQMGGAIAERLLGQPFQLHVYDPAPGAMDRFVAAGAVAHDSARSVGDIAPVVFACLPNREVSHAAALGANGVVHGEAIELYADMSTIGREAIEALADGLHAHDIRTLDAPVTGGPPVARAGRLTMIVSGAPQVVERARPLLALMGREIHVLGDRPGMAQVMKVVNNIIMGANLVVAAEALSFGARAGLDADAMLGVLRGGTGQSFAACEILQRGIAGTFDYGAALTILDKDMTLGLAEARSLEAVMPAIASAQESWHAAYEAGFGREDFTAILKYVEQRNRTLVRARAGCADATPCEQTEV